MKKMKIRVKLESGKKFYESDYRNIYDCYKASEKDAVRKFRKKHPNAIVCDVFSFLTPFIFNRIIIAKLSLKET